MRAPLAVYARLRVFLPALEIDNCGRSRWLLLQPTLCPGTVFFDCTDNNPVVNGGRGGVTTSIVVTGVNFGFGPNTTVAISGLPCVTNVTAHTHTSIICSTDLCYGALVVTVVGQGSAPFAYSYHDLVALPKVRPPPLPSVFLCRPGGILVHCVLFAIHEQQLPPQLLEQA